MRANWFIYCYVIKDKKMKKYSKVFSVIEFVVFALFIASCINLVNHMPPGINQMMGYGVIGVMVLFETSIYCYMPNNKPDGI